MKTSYYNNGQGGISEGEARAIFREDFLGAGELDAALHIPPRLYTMPPILFSPQCLAWAKNAGFMMSLRVNVAGDGRPLTLQRLSAHAQRLFTQDGRGVFLYNDTQYSADPFFVRERPELVWALTAKSLLPGSAGKNYLEQSELLSDYVGGSICTAHSDAFELALIDFLGSREEVRSLMRYGDPDSADLLKTLMLTHLARPSAVEAAYDMAFYFFANGRRLLTGSYTWTSSLALSRNFVKIGRFDESGIDIDTLRGVSYNSDDLGALVSLRMAWKNSTRKR